MLTIVVLTTHVDVIFCVFFVVCIINEFDTSAQVLSQLVQPSLNIVQLLACVSTTLESVRDNDSITAISLWVSPNRLPREILTNSSFDRNIADIISGRESSTG